MKLRSDPCFLARCIRSFTSSTSSEPPMLLRLRSDMKNAMKERNTNRVNVFKGLVSDIVNSSKVNRAVSNDSHVVGIIKARLMLSQKAAAVFAAEARDDLKSNEEAQISVMQGFLDGLEKVPEEDIKKAALEALDMLRIQEKKIHSGSIIKCLIGPEGSLSGKYLDMESVTRIVREIIFTGKSEGMEGKPKLSESHLGRS